jgi:transcriptional regulator with XRE-family HTH domain
VTISPEQAGAARKLVGWSQSDLAHIAGVSELSVRRFEARTRNPWGAVVAALKSAFEEVGVVFFGELGVRAALRESAYRATIVSEANGGVARRMRKEFRSFRSAVHYYVLRLSTEERDACHIVTADGKQWRRRELLAFFKHNK